MGKSEVDLTGDIDEINEHAEVIAAAAKRLEDQGRNSTRLIASGQRRKENAPQFHHPRWLWHNRSGPHLSRAVDRG